MLSKIKTMLFVIMTCSALQNKKVLSEDINNVNYFSLFFEL